MTNLTPALEAKLFTLAKQAGQVHAELQSLIHDLRAGSATCTRPLTADLIISMTAAHYDVPEHILRGRGRTGHIAWARHVCMYLLSCFTKMSRHEIGDYFNRDHSGVTHAVGSVKHRMEHYPGDRSDVEQLRAKLDTIFDCAPAVSIPQPSTLNA